MIKFLVVLFMGNTPAGALQTETLEQCVQTAKEVNADQAKPAEARAACYVLRESA
jgi:hypothetical protein